MKTPKQILLERHEGAEFKLNAVRQRALSALERPKWRGFFWSLRWHLAGLGVVWLTVLILNVDPGSSSPAMAENFPATRTLMASLREHRRELMELTGASAPVEPALPAPRRSEIQRRTVYV